jgi:selenocysteine lyase/cysteine desulfurase
MLTAAATNDVRASAIAELRAREFGRLDRVGIAYLDYTGAAVYGDSQLRAHQELLVNALFGNPHADSDASRASTDILARSRERVLTFLDADPAEYAVCFTANCSAAIKLVAESFPFTRHSTLILAADNHNSINGIREYARRQRATVRYVPLDDELRLCRADEVLEHAMRHRGANLFAYPAQSNFSGVQHPLELIALAHDRGCTVLLDAAAFVPSTALSLRHVQPEFVTLSCYKIFGYPTGVGALVVRRDALSTLRRPWFSGGTVEFASIQNDVHALRRSVEAFEDGTPDFLAIAALDGGFDLLDGIGMPAVSEHVKMLTRHLLEGLRSLRRADGSAGVRVYGPLQTCARGGTVAFNVVDGAGNTVPYQRVEHAARAARIAVRGGCFCNPGVAEYAFGFDRASTRRCMDRASVNGFTNCLGDGATVGAIRASVGLANSEADVDRLLTFLGAFTDI